MGMKKHIILAAIFLMALFGTTGDLKAVETVEPDALLDITIETDQESYTYEDEITSIITITNSSNRYYAENLLVEVELPENFDVIDPDLEIKEGKIAWNLDTIERNETTELTFQTKLNETERERLMESSSPDEPLDTDAFVAPQTSDDTNLTGYILLFVLSVALGLFALFGLRKKKVAKTALLLLAFSMIVPLSALHAESGSEQETTQTTTKSYQLVMGDQTYDATISVTATIQDGQVEIPVTGTAYDADNHPLANQTLTLTTTVDEQVIVETVETDDEGYFVSRLIEGASYTVTTDGLLSTLLANDVNEIKITNDEGIIELGKTLKNGENYSTLQPSIIYLNDETAEHVASITENLTTAIVDTDLDVRAGDIIVVPEWTDYPTGLALYVDSITETNGQLRLEISQPDLEDVFYEIYGNFHVDMAPEHFTPAEGVEMVDDNASMPNQERQLFSSPRANSLDTEAPFAQASTFSASQINRTFSIEMNNDRHNRTFSLDGTVGFGGYVDADIAWRTGLNPVEELQFDFVGNYQLELEVSAGFSIDLIEQQIGKLVIPTPIPALTVNVPIEFVTSFDGQLSTGISTGADFHFGLEYARGSLPRAYPERPFKPYFTVSDITGSASISPGLKFSGLAGLLGIDGFGVSTTGAVNVGAATSLLGDSSFRCLDVAVDFDASVAFEAPLFNDWKYELGSGLNFPLYDNQWGHCINAIEINPNEIELAPGETKTVTVVADNIAENINIADSPNFNFEVSDRNQVSTSIREHANSVDITASDQARNGSIITLTGVYNQHGTRITDTLIVKIVDDRPKGELIGQVVDAITDTPIEQAVIRILDGNDQVARVVTAQDGVYQTMLVPGTYIIEVSHDGYVTDTSRLKVREGDTITYDAKLQLVDSDHAGIGTVTGQVKDSVSGNGIPNTIIEIRKGRNNPDAEIIKTITTDRNGNYQVNLPGGNYTLSLTADHYISATTNILAIGDRTTTNQNATMSPDGLLDEDLRIVLTWGVYPRDLDSHITGPTATGSRFHVSYLNHSFKDALNDVNLDRDDTTSFGPETITVIDRLQMGTYVYAVHNYSGRNINEINQMDLASSGAKVEVYQEDTLVQTFHVPVNQAGNSWRVFEIRDGQIVPINKTEVTHSWRSASDFAPVEN